MTPRFLSVLPAATLLLIGLASPLAASELDTSVRPDPNIKALAAKSPAIAAILKRGKIIGGQDPIYKTFGYRNTATGEYEGFHTDLMKRLALKMLGDERKVQWKFAGGKQDNGNARWLERNDIDIHISMGTVPAFDDLTKMTDEPAYITEDVFLVAKGSPIQSYHDIEKPDVKIVCDRDAIRNIRGKYPHAKIFTFEDRMVEFDFLRAGKADALFGHETMAFHDIMVDPAYRVVRMPTDVRFYRWATRRDDPVFADYVNSFLREIKLSGEYDQICHKWFDIGGADRAVKPFPTLDTIRRRGKVIIGSTFRYRTFAYRNPKNGHYEGYFVDIGRRLAKTMTGDENAVEWRQMKESDELAAVQKGDVDFVIDTIDLDSTGSKSEFAPVYTSDPIFISGAAMLVKKDSPLNNYDEVSDKMTFLYSKDVEADLPHFREFAPNATYIAYDAAEEGLKAFKAGKADAYIDYVPPLYDFAAQNPGYRLTGKTNIRRFYIIGRKDDPVLPVYMNDFVRIFYQGTDNPGARLYAKWFVPYGGNAVR